MTKEIETDSFFNFFKTIDLSKLHNDNDNDDQVVYFLIAILYFYKLQEELEQ